VLDALLHGRKSPPAFLSTKPQQPFTNLMSAKARIGISIPIDELDNLQGLLLNAMLHLDARRGSLV
jgi:hypothetical protein